MLIAFKIGFSFFFFFFFKFLLAHMIFFFFQFWEKTENLQIGQKKKKVGQKCTKEKKKKKETKRSPWTLFRVDLDQHIDIVSFVVGDCLKIDLSTLTPRWPSIKNSWTPRKNLWPRFSSPKFHQNLLNYVDGAFWAYLNNDPQMTFDPKFLNTPSVPPPWWSLCPSITKIHQGIFEKHFLFVIDTQRDTQIQR